MNETTLKKVFKETYPAFIAELIIILLVSNNVQLLFREGVLTVNPLKGIVGVFKYGFPLGPFAVLTLVFTAVYLYFATIKYADMKNRDVMGRNFKMSDKDTYGNAHFEMPEEFEDVARVCSSEDARGIILGQFSDDGSKVLDMRMGSKVRTNQNILIVGASGSGKTFTMSKPYILQMVKRRESIVVTDPDGGLRKDTAKYLMDNGYIVRWLDFKNFNKSFGWNVMESIHENSFDTDSLMLADTIISNVMPNQSGIFVDASRALLTALIMYVYTADAYEEQRTLDKCYDILQKGETGLDEIFDKTKLQNNKNENVMESLKPYNTFKTASPNLHGNIITNLAVSLQILSFPRVVDVLSRSDIDLTLPGKQPCAYFCLFPDNHDAYKVLVSMFFSMIFIDLIDEADNNPSKSLDVPVNFLLDEFPSIGKLPYWDRKMATIRKRHINVTMICQSLAQLTDVYQDSAEVIRANCSVMVILGVNDEMSAKEIEKRIGVTTVQVNTRKNSGEFYQREVLFPKWWREQQSAVSSGEGSQALLPSDQIQKMDKDESIVIFQGHNPIWTKKYPFLLHPQAKYFTDLPIDSISDITDDETREREREEEKNRIEEYNRNHPEGRPVDIDNIDDSVSGEEDLEDTMSEKIGKLFNRLKKEKKEESDIKNDDIVLDENDIEWEDIEFVPIESAEEEPPKPEDDTAEKAAGSGENNENTGENNAAEDGNEDSGETDDLPDIDTWDWGIPEDYESDDSEQKPEKEDPEEQNAEAAAGRGGDKDKGTSANDPDDKGNNDKGTSADDPDDTDDNDKSASASGSDGKSKDTGENSNDKDNKDNKDKNTPANGSKGSGRGGVHIGSAPADPEEKKRGRQSSDRLTEEEAAEESYLKGKKGNNRLNKAYGNISNKPKNIRKNLPPSIGAKQ